MASMFPTPKGGGSSMWTPQAKGNTSSMWKGGFGSAGGNVKNTGSFSKKNPGADEQRNSKKSAGCAFCG